MTKFQKMNATLMASAHIAPDTMDAKTRHLNGAHKRIHDASPVSAAGLNLRRALPNLNFGKYPRTALPVKGQEKSPAPRNPWLDGLWYARTKTQASSPSGARVRLREQAKSMAKAAKAVEAVDEPTPTSREFVSGYTLAARDKHRRARMQFYTYLPLEKNFDWLQLLNASMAPVGQRIEESTAARLANQAGRVINDGVGGVMTALTGQAVQPWTGPEDTGPARPLLQPLAAPTPPIWSPPPGALALVNFSSQAANVMGNGAFAAVASAVHDVARQWRYLQAEDSIAPIWAAKLQHDEAVKETQDRFDSLPEDIASQVQVIDEEIRRKTKEAAPDRYDQVSYENANKVAFLLQRRDLLLCSHVLPKHSASYIDQPGPKAALTALADSFPQRTRVALCDFFTRIKKQRKVAAYFYGSPGTGKSTTAEAIGRALDRPVLHYSYEDFLSKDFLGSKTDWTLRDLDETGERFAGLFLSDLLTVGRSDVIVSINEVDFGEDPRHPSILELNSRMEKKVYEFTNNGVAHPYDAVFIFNGNFPNDKIPATKERIPQIEFSFEEPQKQKKAREVLDALFAMCEEDLTRSQMDQLKAQCEPHFQFVVKCDLRFGDGLRNLETVINGMVGRALDSLEKGEPLDGRTMRDRIMDDFESCTVEEPGVYAQVRDEVEAALDGEPDEALTRKPPES